MIVEAWKIQVRKLLISRNSENASDALIRHWRKRSRRLSKLRWMGCTHRLHLKEEGMVYGHLFEALI
jgi:hypothetical protein